jgi:hypothetical protein
MYFTYLQELSSTVLFSGKKIFPKTPDFSVKIFKECDNE